MENVQLTVNEGIATLVINRPKQLNALNKQTLAEISEAFESMRNDDGVKVVIMTGSGEKAFVAGADQGVCEFFGSARFRTGKDRSYDRFQ